MCEIWIDQQPTEEELSTVLESFRAHNSQFVKDDLVKPIYVILKDELGRIIGYGGGMIVWGWLNINRIWTDTTKQSEYSRFIIKVMQNESIKYGVSKASIGSFSEGEVEIYERLNYKVGGKLKDRPKGFTYYFLRNELLSKSKIDKPHSVEFEVLEDMKEEELEIINSCINEYQQQLVGEQSYKEIKIVAKDSQYNVVGGLTGYIGWDYLYISVIWVKDEIRGSGLGGRLVKIAEKKAVECDINKVFLGTTDFQAKEFYEKLGYIVFMETQNLPTGHTNYSMKKNI